MDRLGSIDVLLLGAVPREISALIGLLQTCQVLASRDQTIWCGRYANLSVLIGTTGLGKVNAAITTASLLERFAVRQVWHLGCAGAYPEGPLRIGDVLITAKTLCGDEGVLTKGGLLSVSQIGIPILIHDGEEIFDQVPLSWNVTMRELIEKTPPGLYRQNRGLLLSSAYLCETTGLPASSSSTECEGIPPPAKASSPSPQAGQENDDECFHLIYGPSLTVGMASGDPQVAGERYHRYGAYAENMEGSAVAHACCRFQIPMVECRGISNFAGIRAKEAWELEKSIAHCHGIIVNWLDAMNSVELLS